MRITRRVVAGGCLALAAGEGQSAEAQECRDGLSGCALAGRQLAAFNGDSRAVDILGGAAHFIRITGHSVTDQAFHAALARLAGFSGQRPAYMAFDDGENLNAFASSAIEVPRTNGTVLFGVRLFNALRATHGDMSIVLVAAHEFGHIAQFNAPATYNELRRRAGGTATLVELHADYLAGFYLAELKRNNPTMSNAFVSRLMRSLGDSMIGSCDHHGTPDQRFAATEEGYNLGRRSRLPYRDAFRTGAGFVTETFG